MTEPLIALLCCGGMAGSTVLPGYLGPFVMAACFFGFFWALL
ncbi:MAG: hypothetical protein AB7I36_08370 [Rhodospirillaceae bacterium]